MRTSSQIAIGLVMALTAFAGKPANAASGPVCEVYSATSETSSGPAISVSAKCEVYGDWMNLSPDAELETVVVAPDSPSSKTFVVNAQGYTALDIPFQATRPYGKAMAEAIMAQDPSITHVDNIYTVKAIFKPGTRVYRDTRLEQEVTK